MTPALSEYASTAWEHNAHTRSKSMKKIPSIDAGNELIIREVTRELDENIEDSSSYNGSENEKEYLAQKHHKTFGKYCSNDSE